MTGNPWPLNPRFHSHVLAVLADWRLQQSVHIHCPSSGGGGPFSTSFSFLRDSTRTVVRVSCGHASFFFGAAVLLFSFPRAPTVVEDALRQTFHDFNKSSSVCPILNPHVPRCFPVSTLALHRQVWVAASFFLSCSYFGQDGGAEGSSEVVLCLS